MCYSRTDFYHSCQHYGVTPRIVDRCIRGETLASMSKGCEYTQTLGVVAHYTFCPRCEKDPAENVPLPTSPVRPRSAPQRSSVTQKLRTESTGQSTPGGRTKPKVDLEYFNGLVKQHNAAFNSPHQKRQ